MKPKFKFDLGIGETKILLKITLDDTELDATGLDSSKKLWD